MPTTVLKGRRFSTVQLADAWPARVSITDGAMLRRLKVELATLALTSDRAAARVLQARAAIAGFDPARFAGHSLRTGFVTVGVRAGTSVFKLIKIRRHRRTNVFASYLRDVRLFEDHAGEDFL